MLRHEETQGIKAESKLLGGYYYWKIWIFFSSSSYFCLCFFPSVLSVHLPLQKISSTASTFTGPSWGFTRRIARSCLGKQWSEWFFQSHSLSVIPFFQLWVYRNGLKKVNTSHTGKVKIQFVVNVRFRNNLHKYQSAALCGQCNCNKTFNFFFFSPHISG